MDKYFDKFPVIRYANTDVVDITKRVVVRNEVFSSPYTYYPYDLATHERADQFASRYYSDAFKTWLLYLTNGVIDPYYEWYMDDEEFNKFIVKKYGSIISASTKIKNYRVNWPKSDPIRIEEYDSLPENVKDYWQPVWDMSGKLYHYVRMTQDWVINTNKIIEYTVANNSFIQDEICTINFNASHTGQGQVLSTAFANTVLLQHISGNYLPNPSILIAGSSYIYGTESSTNAIFTTATQVANNLQPNEEIYWEGVTYYDYEKEKNESHKTIKVLDKTLAPEAVKELTNLLKE